MTRLALLLAAAALCGCAGAAPVRRGDVRPPVAPAVKYPTIPPTHFLGNYPSNFRAVVQAQWAALPAEMRNHAPPKFRLATGNEMKKMPGLMQEASGAYDTQNKTVWGRADRFDYVSDIGQHELGGHWSFYIGADPKSGDVPLMTAADRQDWHRWVQSKTDDPKDGTRENYQIIPQYTHQIQGKRILDRELTQEKWAQAAVQVWTPGGKPHPAYGRPHPAVVTKLNSYFRL